MNGHEELSPAEIPPAEPANPLAEQLARVRAERAELEAERNAAQAERELAQQLARETMALADEKAIAQAEREHGPLGEDIAAIPTKQGVVIVKRPTHAQYKRFHDAAKQNADTQEQLVRPLLVWPDLGAFDHYVKKEPVIILRAAGAALKLAGMREEEAAGK